MGQKIKLKRIGILYGYKLYDKPDMKSPLAIGRLSNSGEYILMRGRSYTEYTPEEIEIIFYHEMGHKELGLATDYDIELETNCDIYSAKFVGVDRVLQCLKKSLSLLKTERARGIIEARIQGVKQHFGIK